MKLNQESARVLGLRMGLILVIGVLAVPALMADQSSPAPVPTFTKDIAPILQRSCENCHRPGGGAPMSLMSYEEVRPWAAAIKRKTATREMPPWFIEKNVGIQQFKEDPSLSDAEIATVMKWAESGMPRGEAADMPPARQYAAAGGWSIGVPDVVISSAPVSISAMAPDYWGPIGEGGQSLGLQENRYVKAVEVKEVRVRTAESKEQSGDRAALTLFSVHHAVVNVNAADPSAGGSSRDPEGFQLTYEVGQNATIFPDDASPVLPAGALVDFPNEHLHAVGRDVVVRLDVAFKFHPRGYKPKYVLSHAGGGGHELLDIPAGEDNVRFDDFKVLKTATKIVTFEPHMHARGKRMCMEAIYPNGVHETLNCAAYNHNWAKVYTYEDDAAPLLPAGSIIHIIGWYDNSVNNPRNPEPRNWDGFGFRSIDDMFLALNRGISLTDEQYRAELAAREAKRKVHTSTKAPH